MNSAWVQNCIAAIVQLSEAEMIAAVARHCSQFPGTASGQIVAAAIEEMKRRDSLYKKEIDAAVKNMNNLMQICDGLKHENAELKRELIRQRVTSKEHAIRLLGHRQTW